jgi:hypothetical protein
MILAGNNPHKNREKDLKKHTGADEDEDPGVVGEVKETVHQAFLALGLGVGVEKGLAAIDVFLLEFGDVEESTVGSVEKRNAAWQPETHDPEFSITGCESTVHETNLDKDPINV